VQTTRFGLIDASIGPIRALLRLTADYEAASGTAITAVDEAGKQDEATGEPVAFRVAHEIVVHPGRPDFRARFVSVENTGDKPLVVNGYFFYLSSSIGGDPAGDAPATPAVPNYWSGGDGAWRDGDVEMVFGAEAAPGSDLDIRFWLDEAGGQHPDARRSFETPITLQPGESYSEPDAPWLTVYGTDAGGTPWLDVQRRAKLLDQVVVAVR